MSPKAIIRGNIKTLLKSCSREDFCSQGKSAAVLLLSSPVWARYTTVFIFLSLDSEIDTQPLIEPALKAGKRLFAPRIENKELVFRPVLSPDGPWRKGPFGIREPAPGFPGQCEFPKAGDSAVFQEWQRPLILTPGLAFDREGNRLGRGGGYYDRFFAKLDREGLEYFTLGFCMDFQLVDHVPVCETDKKMDGVLTVKGFRMLE